MGLKFTNYFDDSMYESSHVKILACSGCSSHLCLSDLVVCDGFTGASGPALLVDKLINIEPDSPLHETHMKTGHYQIYKVRCHQCRSPLGWYYKKAYRAEQTYKEGKFVLEKAYIKYVTNHPSTNDLMEQAMRNKIRRRYSSTSTISSADSDDKPADAFKFAPASPESRKPSLDYRDYTNGLFLNRLRIPGIKNVDEDDEDEVFVDA